MPQKDYKKIYNSFLTILILTTLIVMIVEVSYDNYKGRDALTTED